MSPLQNLAPAILFTPDRKVAASAPYPITFLELTTHFGRSAYRQQLLRGFRAWLSALRQVVSPQFVWIGGSFVTDKPEPKDIDAVVFYRYLVPDVSAADRDNLLRANTEILSHTSVERRFNVESALVPLDVDATQLFHASAYWAMVFSNDAKGGRRAFYTMSCAEDAA
jgi:hypothetical protein